MDKKFKVSLCEYNINCGYISGKEGLKYFFIITIPEPPEPDNILAVLSKSLPPPPEPVPSCPDVANLKLVDAL